jgi:hypothetical protein
MKGEKTSGKQRPAETGPAGIGALPPPGAAPDFDRAPFRSAAGTGLPSGRFGQLSTVNRTGVRARRLQVCRLLDGFWVQSRHRPQRERRPARRRLYDIRMAIELVTLVGNALDQEAAVACVAGDADGNGRITVEEIVRGVGNALDHCSAAALPG